MDQSNVIEAFLTCHDWPIGCPRGDACAGAHPPNLDPSLCEEKQHDYMVPSTTHVACQRCLQVARECDKKGRPDDDDPCSECRWFGGESCRCTLEETSYNDQMWVAMFDRSKQNYTLPAEMRPDEIPSEMENGFQVEVMVPPAPMPADKVKHDWVGQTKEELLAKPVFLPDFIRDRPRAYLIPPVWYTHPIRDENGFDLFGFDFDFKINNEGYFTEIDVEIPEARPYESDSEPEG